jgi:hypothetical protein
MNQGMNRMKSPPIILIAIGLAGVALSLPLYEGDPERVSPAVCAAWWLGLSLAVGALGAALALDVAHATWFVVFRPIAMAIAATVPVLALGLVPAAYVAPHVYPWAGAVLHEGALSHDVVVRLARTRPWMSPWPVYVRTVISLVLWSGFAIVLRDRVRRRVSAVGLPVLAITATVAPFDWMMSVEPGWTSTIFGLYFAIGGFYGATGLVAVFTWVAIRRRTIAIEPRPDHVHALGRIMLTAVCLWGYLGFFQLMLQWIGNLPAEVGFWVRRLHGGWAPVTALLVVGHFVVPFFLLLSRPLKRNPGSLAAVGALMVVTHVVDVMWLVLPSRASAPFPSVLAPIAAIVGLGGAFGLWRFVAVSRAPLPAATAQDPDFLRGVRYESP